MSDQPEKKKRSWLKRTVKLNLDKQVHFNCATCEHAAWTAAAEASGMPLHVWMRCILDAAAGVSEMFVQLQRTILEMYLRRAEHMRDASEFVEGKVGRQSKKG